MPGAVTAMLPDPVSTVSSAGAERRSAVTLPLPVSSATFFKLVGVVEMAAGALVLSKWTRLGAYVVAAWLVAIALQLASTGMFYDLAVRDLVMACAAFALAKLTEERTARRAAAAA